MFDHDDADTFSNIARLRHAYEGSKPGPGAAWGKATKAGHRAPRPDIEDDDGNPIPAATRRPARSSAIGSPTTRSSFSD